MEAHQGLCAIATCRNLA